MFPMRVKNFSLKLVVAIITLRTSVCLMHHYTRSLTEGRAEITDTFEARSKIQCAAACARSETCISFSYNKNASQCIHSNGLLDQVRPGQAVYSDNRLKIPATTSFASTTSTAAVTTGNTVTCPGHFETKFGNCFEISTSKKDWFDAQDDCVNKGGHLFILRTQTDFNLLSQATVSDREYWIDGKGSGTWDGSALLSTKWDPEEGPLTRSDHCAIFDHGDEGDKMEHKLCEGGEGGGLYHYICQVDGIPPVDNYPPPRAK